MAHVWSQYQELLKERSQLSLSREAHYKEIALYEKDRADSVIELNSKRLDIERRQYVLQQKEEEYSSQLLVLKKQAENYNISFKNLQKEKSIVNASN